MVPTSLQRVRETTNHRELLAGEMPTTCLGQRGNGRFENMLTMNSVMYCAKKCVMCMSTSNGDRQTSKAKKNQVLRVAVS